MDQAWQRRRPSLRGEHWRRSEGRNFKWLLEIIGGVTIIKKTTSMRWHCGQPEGFWMTSAACARRRQVNSENASSALVMKDEAASVGRPPMCLAAPGSAVVSARSGREDAPAAIPRHPIDIALTGTARRRHGYQQPSRARRRQTRAIPVKTRVRQQLASGTRRRWQGLL